MKYCPIFEILFITCALGILSVGNGQCTVGQYLIGENDCTECPSGTYMDFRNHNKRTCIKCTSVEDPKYEILHPCNSTHDAVLQCSKGYFNTNGHPVVCQGCHGCDYVVRNCTPVEDTICCPQEDMTLIEVNGNGTCETYSPDHRRYCCVLKTTFYSTTSSSSSKHYTDQESISFNTKIEESSSPASMTSSVGHEAGRNSSRTGSEESSSNGMIAVYVFIAVVAVAVIIVIMICVRRRHRRQSQKQKGAKGEKSENDEETVNL